jgi:hypothetical protein
MFDLVLLPDEQNRAILYLFPITNLPNDKNLDAKGRGK